MHAVRSGLKAFRSTTGGFVDDRYSVLNLSDTPSQRLVVFMSAPLGCLAEVVTCTCPVSEPDLESRCRVVVPGGSADE